MVLWDSSLDGPPESSVLLKVYGALDLLQEFHPSCWRSLERYVRFIRLMSIAFDAGWGPLERCVVLDPGFVKRSSSHEVAYILVHELTHARVWWAGLPYSQTLAGRIEGVATRRMVAFATRMGADEDLLRRMEAGAYDPSDAFIVQKGKEAVLRGGQPTWLDEVLSRLHLWFARHSRKR